jgi:WD40 repeat protein
LGGAESDHNPIDGPSSTCENILTFEFECRHGRDNRIRVWQLALEDEAGNLSSTLPENGHREQTPKPWLLHSVPVNTLNFCSFSMCYQHPAASTTADDSIFVAVPSTDDKVIDVYSLPAELLKARIPQIRTVETGMVMAVRFVRNKVTQTLLLLAGYEGGVTAAFQLAEEYPDTAVGTAQLVYLSQPHTQPILSLDASPNGDFYYTSSADAVIAKHQISELPPTASEQGHTPLPKPPPGVFAEKPIDQPNSNAQKPGGLSSLLSSAAPLPKVKPAPPVQPVVTLQAPYKVVDTKHAGQQSLRVRSDGRLLITGGWDTRIRVYSTKTLKEVAVLKWHKEGVYSVAFGEILTQEELGHGDGATNKRQRERDEQTKLKHWVAAGAKDGKVSLWEVF